MSEPGKQYIKFMSDIIDSGLWGRLSPAAKTLYPVLLKFSDQNFKHVWPSTDTLLKLTGFKTKKSIMLGKKELLKEGLLHYKSGCGRTNSTYYFSFNYEGSKITPQWHKPVTLSDINPEPSALHTDIPQGSRFLPPNNLNITINNNHSTKQDSLEITYQDLLSRYGLETVESAVRIARTNGFENNLGYILGICKEIVSKKINFNQSQDVAQHVIDSWKNFLNWSKSHLTRSSTDILEGLSIEVDGQSIFIKQPLSEFLKQIILKYFKEEVSPSLFIIFAETSNIRSTNDRQAC